MSRTISKRFLTSTIGSALVLGAALVFACAGGDEFIDFWNSFFAPEVSNAKESKPFYRSMSTFYGEYGFHDVMQDMDSINIEEWYQLFERRVSTDDLSYIVYKSRIGEVDTCIFHLRNRSFPIHADLKRSSLLAYPNTKLTVEFLFYLGFAKRCEPFATYVPDWWNDDPNADPRSNKEAMQKLLDGGHKALLRAETPFIKQRYAFQIARLHYQAGQYRDAITFLNDNGALFEPLNTSYYRALGYVAASHYKLMEFSEANYLYSKIFDRCSYMRKSSYRSFFPQNDSDWYGALEMAKTDREREVLWHLLGIYVDPLRAMREIYTINPKSDMLDLLLVRAINIGEESFLNANEYWRSETSTYAFRPENIDSELMAFVTQTARSQATAKPYLWDLAAGYLHLIAGNYSESDAFLTKAESAAKTDVLVQEQIKAFRIVSAIEQYESEDAKTEEKLASNLKWLGLSKRHDALRNQHMFTWAKRRLSEKYAKWGDPIKSQLLDDAPSSIYYKEERNINSIIELMDKPQKSEFEKFILGIYPHSKATLYTYKAIIRIYQNNFREALAMLEACDNTGNGDFPADPFSIRINDCHDCDFEEHDGPYYNHHSFVKRMIELEEMSKSDPKNAANHYFQLANGLYNMTYFGNSHIVFRSPLVNLSVGYIDWGSDNLNHVHQYLSCKKAMEYYVKAMEASTDMEFKAMCCFMAAKCEQNEFFISSDFSWESPIRAGKYFGVLYGSYSKTKYYQEIIRECGYFRDYVNM